MFPSIGYFDGIKCPFFFLQSCPRPYCHFQHLRGPESPNRGFVENSSIPSTSSGVGDFSMPSTSDISCVGDLSLPSTSSDLSCGTSESFTPIETQTSDVAQHRISCDRGAPVSHGISSPYEASFRITNTNNDNAQCTVMHQPHDGAFHMLAGTTAQFTMSATSPFQDSPTSIMKLNIYEDDLFGNSSPDAKFSSDDDNDDNINTTSVSMSSVFQSSKTLNSQPTVSSSSQRSDFTAVTDRNVTGRIKTQKLSGDMYSKMNKSNCMLKPQVTSSAYSIPNCIPEKNISEDTSIRENKKRRKSATSISSDDSSHKRKRISEETVNDPSSEINLKHSKFTVLHSSAETERTKNRILNTKTGVDHKNGCVGKVLNEKHNEHKKHVECKVKTDSNKVKIHSSSHISKGHNSKHDSHKRESSHKHEHSQKQNSSKMNNEKTTEAKEKKRLHSIHEKETNSKNHSEKPSTNHNKQSSSSHHKYTKDSTPSHGKSGSRESRSSHSKNLKESNSFHSRNVSKESVSAHSKSHSKHSSRSDSKSHHSKERSSHSKIPSRESNTSRSQNSSREPKPSNLNNHKVAPISSKDKKNSKTENNIVEAEVTNLSVSEDKQQEKSTNFFGKGINLDELEVDDEAVADFLDNEFLLYDLGEVDEMFREEDEREAKEELNSKSDVNQKKEDSNKAPHRDETKVDQKSFTANKSPTWNSFPENSSSFDYTFARGRKRIAHVPNVSLILNAKSNMENKMKNQNESRPCTVTSSSGSSVWHTANTISSAAETRPSTTSAPHGKVLPVLKSPCSRGVVMREKRQKYLYSLFKEYGKYTDSSEAINLAEESEYEAYSGSTSSNVYCCRIANCIKRIRQSGSSLGKTGGSASWNTQFGNKSKAAKDAKFYELLSKYILDDNQLTTNGYPRPHPTDSGVAVVQPYRKPLLSSKPSEKICCRCGTQYRVDEHGYQIKEEECIYHYGHLIKMRLKGALESRFWCCKAEHDGVGCATANCHVFEDYDPNYLPGFVTTYSKNQIPDDGNYGVFALDCEMVYTTAGLELARVTVINPYRETVYETLVNPLNEILDYNTRFSGLKEESFTNVTTTIKDVQSHLLKMFNDKTILVGHSLDSDLKALKIIHDTVVDTSVMFPHRLGSPYKRSLKNLAQEILRRVIQEDVGGHDSTEDAVAAMDLVLWRIAEDSRFTLT